VHNACVQMRGGWRVAGGEWRENSGFVRRWSPDPADRLTEGLQVTRRRSTPAVAEAGRVIKPLPETASTSRSSSVLNGRPVEISRGFWNSSAISTQQWVQPTAAKLGIGSSFLST